MSEAVDPRVKNNYTGITMELHATTLPAPTWAERFDRASVTSHRLASGHIATVLTTTVVDAVAMADRVPATQMEEATDGGNSSWSERWDVVRQRLLTGSGREELSERVEQSLGQMSVPITVAPRWRTDAAGYYPIAALAAAGSPIAMRNRTDQASDGNPVRVFFPLACSWNITPDEFADMMIDVVGALQALSVVRPVELILYDSTGAAYDRKGVKMRHSRDEQACFWLVPIDISYGDARSLALWCDPSVGRAVFHAMMKYSGTGYHGQWPWTAEEKPKTESALALYAEAMGAKPDDVVIPPICGRANDNRTMIRQRLDNLMTTSGIELTR